MKILKITILVLIIVLLGIFAYFARIRYGLTKVGISESYALQLTKKLTGRIVKGEFLNDLPPECSPQYFLVNKKARVWLVPSYNNRTSWPEIFSDYNQTIVEVEGDKDFDYSPCKYGAGADCGCSSYLIVTKIKEISD